LHEMPQQEFEKKLNQVPGLAELINEFHKNQDQEAKLFLMEFALHGLAEFSLISKHNLTAGLQFRDLLSGMFTLPKPGDEDEDDDDENFSSGRR
jgi:magnesium chelatase subunit I